MFARQRAKALRARWPASAGRTGRAVGHRDAPALRSRGTRLALLPLRPAGVAGPEEVPMRRVQFVPVGRERREWMWKARDDSNTIAISGQRFETLGDAVRDARTQIAGPDDDTDDGPWAA
jgi:hypothetical protein